MRRVVVVAALASALAIILAAVTVTATGGGHRFRASLTGFQEVPSISTTGHGSIRVWVDDGTLKYRLSYTAMSSTVTAAHIHFGQPAVIAGRVYANVHTTVYPVGEIRGHLRRP